MIVYPIVSFKLGLFPTASTRLSDILLYKLKVRLVGGRYPSQGRVEVYCNGQWGTICSTQFQFGTAEANTVCRQLGYTAATRYNHLSLWVASIEIPRPVSYITACSDVNWCGQCNYDDYTTFWGIEMHVWTIVLLQLLTNLISLCLSSFWNAKLGRNLDHSNLNALHTGCCECVSWLNNKSKPRKPWLFFYLYVHWPYYFLCSPGNDNIQRQIQASLMLPIAINYI